VQYVATVLFSNFTYAQRFLYSPLPTLRDSYYKCLDEYYCWAYFIILLLFVVIFIVITLVSVTYRYEICLF